MNAPSASSTDVVVVGAGPVGASTARWLAATGHRVTVVGPSEPVDHASTGSPWSGHYDSGRIGAVDAVYVASVLGVRAIRRFGHLADASGLAFTSPMPLLTTFPASATPAADDSVASWRNMDALLANAGELGGVTEVLSADEVGERFPAMRVPADQVAVLQPDALLIDPRKFTAAELLLAQRAGAIHVEDVVTALERDGSQWRVSRCGGDSLRADRVVVAVGAYTNASGLLAPHVPGAVDTAVFGSTIVLLEVDGPGAADFPGYMFSSDHYGGGLVTPPRRYPDGRWYLKCASGELVDNPLATAAEIESWVRSGGSVSEVDWFRSYVGEVLPDVAVSRALAKPCLPSFNSSGLPYIDRVADGLVLATEGERGVMAADEIGRLAAGLAAEDRWIDPLPSHLFTARWASQNAPATSGQRGGSRSTSDASASSCST